MLNGRKCFHDMTCENLKNKWLVLRFASQAIFSLLLQQSYHSMIGHQAFIALARIDICAK